MKTVSKMLLQIAGAALVFSAVSAKGGREFAGFYQISDVVEMGDSVLLTFTVDAFKFSDADVLQAQVVLTDWLHLDACGSAADIAIPDRGKVRIQGEVEKEKAQLKAKPRWEAPCRAGINY